jgi:hypothetical protein
MHTNYWLESLKGRDHLDDLGIDGSVILKLVLGKEGEKLWAGFIWVRIGTNDRNPFITTFTRAREFHNQLSDMTKNSHVSKLIMMVTEPFVSIWQPQSGQGLYVSTTRSYP